MSHAAGGDPSRSAPRRRPPKGELRQDALADAVHRAADGAAAEVHRVEIADAKLMLTDALIEEALRRDKKAAQENAQESEEENEAADEKPAPKPRKHPAKRRT